jgi:heme-degrading monooxygenase HmoA
MDMPWKMIATPEISREYLALLTYLPLARLLQVPLFFAFIFRIQRQLAHTPGVIGYTLRAKPFEKDFWTLSVWESEEALMDFIRNDPHAEAMPSFEMGPTKVTRWKLIGADVPPSWKDSLRHLKEDLNG